MKLNELDINQKESFILLLMSSEERMAKNGRSYCHLVLTDGDSIVETNLWDTTKAMMPVEEKMLCSITLSTKAYNGGIGYDVQEIKPAPEGYKAQDYVLSAPYPAVEMYDNIVRLISTCASSETTYEPLSNLVLDLYGANKDNIMYWSAAKSVHHNCYSGLLYHVYRMIYSANMLTKVYTKLDKELLICGVALHDIGKLKELQTDSLGIADYLPDGNLFGHSLLGIEMITETASRHNCNPEKIRLLKHMLASHHGKLELGAITEPAIPEAMMLHEIDMVDSKMYQYEEAYDKTSPGKISDKIFGLGTRIYKPNL